MALVLDTLNFRGLRNSELPTRVNFVDSPVSVPTFWLRGPIVYLTQALRQTENYRYETIKTGGDDEFRRRLCLCVIFRCEEDD